MYKLFLALKYLRSRKVMLFPVIGVALGVMALVVVLSVMSGFDTQLRQWIRGVNAHLIVQGVGLFGIKDYQPLIADIAKVEHVVACAPFVEVIAFIKVRDDYDWCMVRGIDPEAEARVSEIGKYVSGGRGLNFTPPNDSGKAGVLIGAELAKYFYLKPGDEVILVGLREQSMSPGYKPAEVVSVFKSGMYDYDSRYVLMPLEEAISKEFLSTGGAVTGISVKLDDYANAPKVKAKLDAIFSAYDHPLMVQTWEEKQAPLLRAVALERRVQAVILSFIVLVAGFGIASILTMVVAERTRDIGVIRAVGGTPGGVAGIFLAVGGVTATIGAIAGAAAGIAFTLNINRISDVVYKLTNFKVFPPDVYYFDKIPTEISPVRISVTVIAAISVGLAASLLPALRASRLDPVEAIRYE